MPTAIPLGVQALLPQLRRVDPRCRVNAELLLGQADGAEAMTNRIRFLEICRDYGLWRGVRRAPSNPDETIVTLAGRARDLVEALTRLERTERELT